MTNQDAQALELTYPLRTASRLTGLSPDLLRAWEKRYGVVVPMRTPGGTRRYTAGDIERLQLVKAVVDSGHRIGEVAQLDDVELRQRAQRAEPAAGDRFHEVLSAIGRLEAAQAHRLLSQQLSILGPSAFARDFALPLVQQVGELWAEEKLGIASEHLATSVLRSMLGSAMQPSAVSQQGPVIIFGTPSGERHELGLLMAALTALGAGANVIYLGTELPAADLVGAVETSGCHALALSLVTIPTHEAEVFLADVRRLLPTETQLWIGGRGAQEVSTFGDVRRVGSLEELEQQVTLLGLIRS